LIDYLNIKGFKSFENIELELGALNFFIGANSSGKSNFFDALRVLQGIGYGLRVDEIFNGKPKSGNSDVWEPIRGGGANAGLLKWDADRQKNVRHPVFIAVGGFTALGTFRYQIALSPTRGTVLREQFVARRSLQPFARFAPNDMVFSSDAVENAPDGPGFWVEYARPGRGRHPHYQFDRGKPVLSQIAPQCTPRQAERVRALLSLLSNCQRLDPSPPILREYSSGREVRRMGERGENFAALVKTILDDQETAAAYRSWLERLTPKDLDDVAILHGALGEPLFALKHGGREFAAPILSDGTLRFAALTAAFFQPDMPQTLILEEIENGIHPSRLRLLVDLLKARSSDRNGPQIMASTHSPVIVDWLKEEDLEHCFLCRHDESTGVSLIQPLSELPRFAELSKKQPAGDLFIEGWMENSA
jgi:energy-coupling factor transporter ATP-binding protein EcfA2